MRLGPRRPLVPPALYPSPRPWHPPRYVLPVLFSSERLRCIAAVTPVQPLLQVVSFSLPFSQVYAGLEVTYSANATDVMGTGGNFTVRLKLWARRHRVPAGRTSRADGAFLPHWSCIP